MIRPISLVTTAAICLAGCATPNVKYGHFTQDNPRKDISVYADTYMLPKTILTLEKLPDNAAVEKRSARDEAKTGETYALKLRREEDPKYSFGIKSTNRYGVATSVSLIKLENTQIIQSASVSTTDNRKEYAAQAFKLLGTIAGIVVTGDTVSRLTGQRETKPPLDIDTLSLLEENNCLRKNCEIAKALKLPGGATVLLKVSPVPPDAMSIENFSEELGSAGAILATSSCRRATVRVSIGSGNEKEGKGNDDLVSNFSLADPRYVQLVGLPVKGTITMHSECGYSVLPEGTHLVPDPELINSILDELVQLRQNLKKNGGEHASGGD